MNDSICLADVLRIECGPNLVPFPKLVVISNGIPYNIAFASRNEILIGASIKLYSADVFSGGIAKFSRELSIFN